MSIKINKDYKINYKDGSEFSSKKLGFLIIESTELAAKNEIEPPLQIYLHIELLCNLLENDSTAKEPINKCLWLVESPNSKALDMIKKEFPENEILNGSIAGYFNYNRDKIKIFWEIFHEIDKKHPWQNEQAWAIAGITDNIPTPHLKGIIQRPYWSVEHILKHHEKVHSIFVQRGWFAFLAVRNSSVVERIIKQEFPQLEF
jgi:hypothetical protein